MISLSHSLKLCCWCYESTSLDGGGVDDCYLQIRFDCKRDRKREMCGSNWERGQMADVIERALRETHICYLQLIM